ncbi:hypothetical protein PTE30175_01499 [Pandoraea terrae]|uniref:Uncharacterized protein n=1 Tax=Pandoraea terrae TaxID=1537710 RepID=A0A5E4TPT7_9BURK|nr:hypothetical protein [Pandoraea terrae]VVD89920.1 hypothetical protein PTE30175_01499 [Pandoraea terrae]
MLRIATLTFGLLLCASSFASPQDAATPSPNKVYPPLPSMDMLPPAAAESATPPNSGRGYKKISTRVHKSAAPTAYLVVSDASRAYLTGVERELNQALQK